jgi:hypothetical protein
VRNYALRMSDVWKMSKSNRDLLLRSRKVRKEKQSNYCGDVCFHWWFSMAAAHLKTLRQRGEFKISLTTSTADKYSDPSVQIFPADTVEH